MNTRARQLKVKIKDIIRIKKDVALLSFACRYLARTSWPGNFLHIKIDEVLLRRPFSIHQLKQDKVFVLFKIKGRGTRALASYKRGRQLDIIGPLGRGFNIAKSQSSSSVQNILVAGGIGVAPLVFLAQKLKRNQGPRFKTKNNLVLLGAKNKDQILCANEFKQLGWKVLIATDDGTRGFNGTVTRLLENIIEKAGKRQQRLVYACGPSLMLGQIQKLLKKKPHFDCQVSFEQFMGCGLGVCCACVIKTKDGYKKVCKEGPVFDIKDIS